jgi:hypothetical protein
MRNSVLLILTSLVLGACARDCRTGSVGGDSDEARVIRLDSPWMAHVKECPVGAYLVDGPSEGPYEDLVISKNGKPLIGITSDKEITVYGEDGQVAFLVADRNGDGVFDFVSYKTAVKEDQEHRFDIIDRDMDGEPDTKIGDGGPSFAKIDGRWLPLERRGDVTGVIVDAEWQPAQLNGAQWQVLPR